MFKKIALPAIALFGMLAAAPHAAQAAVRFGVAVGPEYCAPARVVVAPRPAFVERRIIRHDYRWDRRDYRARR